MSENRGPHDVVSTVRRLYPDPKPITVDNMRSSEPYCVMGALFDYLGIEPIEYSGFPTLHRVERKMAKHGILRDSEEWASITRLNDRGRFEEAWAQLEAVLSKTETVE